MRLTQKKIEEILVNLLGEDGLSLIRQLTNRDNISEFDLANKTKKDIKVIRKLLYILYNHNLVSFNRKKDKLKGWYIYYWTLLPESIKYLYFKKKRERLVKLNAQLEEEVKELFFVCPNNCVRLNFDQAMDIEFHCPECGELVSQDNGESVRTSLKKEIQELEGELRGNENAGKGSGKKTPRPAKKTKAKANKKAKAKKEKTRLSPRLKPKKR